MVGVLSLESSFGEFAVNPIGAFFDPDSTYDAQKASAKESLRLSVETRLRSRVAYRSALVSVTEGRGMNANRAPSISDTHHGAIDSSSAWCHLYLTRHLMEPGAAISTDVNDLA